MKILHVFNELKFSGAEIMYTSAVSIFKGQGCELSVISTTSKLGEYASEFSKAGYEVYHRPYTFSRLQILPKIRYYRNFISFLKENKFDIVHIHAQRLMLIMAMCAWIANIKSVYTFHSSFVSKETYIYHWLRRKIAKKIFGANFQSISDSVYEHEKSFYNNDTLKIYNWYNSFTFKPAEENQKYKLREHLNINKDALVLITVGGCSKVKRHTEVIKAMPIILEKVPNTIYLHLGSGYMLDDEIRLSKELNVYDHIMFVGNTQDVANYLLSSDIYIMTSLYEGIPISTIEAMACGIPAVLYNVTGLNNFNRKKECSILIKEDYNELAKSISSLSKDKDKQKLLIDNAIDLVLSTYDVKKNALQILDMYKSLLA